MSESPKRFPEKVIITYRENELFDFLIEYIKKAVEKICNDVEVRAFSKEQFPRDIRGEVTRFIKEKDKFCLLSDQTSKLSGRRTEGKTVSKRNLDEIAADIMLHFLKDIEQGPAMRKLEGPEGFEKALFTLGFFADLVAKEQGIPEEIYISQPKITDHGSFGRHFSKDKNKCEEKTAEALKTFLEKKFSGMKIIILKEKNDDLFEKTQAKNDRTKTWFIYDRHAVTLGIFPYYDSAIEIILPFASMLLKFVEQDLLKSTLNHISAEELQEATDRVVSEKMKLFRWE